MLKLGHFVLFLLLPIAAFLCSCRHLFAGFPVSPFRFSLFFFFLFCLFVCPFVFFFVTTPVFRPPQPATTMGFCNARCILMYFLVLQLLLGVLVAASVVSSSLSHSLFPSLRTTTCSSRRLNTHLRSLPQRCRTSTGTAHTSESTSWAPQRCVRGGSETPSVRSSSRSSASSSLGFRRPLSSSLFARPHFFTPHLSARVLT